MTQNRNFVPLASHGGFAKIKFAKLVIIFSCKNTWVYDMLFFVDRTTIREAEVPEELRDLAKTKQMELIGKMFYTKCLADILNFAMMCRDGS